MCICVVYCFIYLYLLLYIQISIAHCAPKLLVIRSTHSMGKNFKALKFLYLAHKFGCVCVCVCIYKVFFFYTFTPSPSLSVFVYEYIQNADSGIGAAKVVCVRVANFWANKHDAYIYFCNFFLRPAGYSGARA